MILLRNKHLTPYFYRVRIYITSNSTKQIIDFNPIKFPDIAIHSIWFYKEGFICNLDFDPKKWRWKNLGGLQESSFFNYQTKSGYRQASQNYSNTSPFDKELPRLGYFPHQRRLTHNEIWHVWKPRKTSSFVWLLFNKRIPIGCWRKKINLPTNCRLCNNDEEKDEEHAFFTCPSFKYAWAAFDRLKRYFSLPSLTTWEEVRTRFIPQPHQFFHQTTNRMGCKIFSYINQRNSLGFIEIISTLEHMGSQDTKGDGI